MFRFTLAHRAKDGGAEDDNSGLEVFNREVLLERVGGDEELLAELGVIFLEDCPQMMENIRLAIQVGDADKLQHATHAIKGCAANLAASATQRAALTLEQIGREGRLMDALGAYERLQRETARLKAVLECMLKSMPPGSV